MIRLVFIGFLLLCLSSSLKAQEPPRPLIDLETFAERLFPLQEEDLPYEDLYENLLHLYTQPLDLNKATREDLQALYLLTPHQIESLLLHRERTGPLLSLYELQAIPGWDLNLIRQVLPFVQVRDAGLQADNRGLLQQLLKSGNRFVMLRWERGLELPKGFSAAADSLPPAFEGSPDKLYFRLRMSKSRNFSLGLTAEKDAGEALQFSPANKRWGADFYSFHAMIWNRGPFKRLVLGDFQVQYGQGLVLGAGFYLGKGAETITTVARPSIGIRPYSSVVESGFFRGLGATWANKSAEITLFASSSPRDASLTTQNDTLDGAAETVFASFQTSGLHRTQTEIANRHSIKEHKLGTAGRWQLFPGKLALGFTGLYTKYSKALMPQTQLYNRFAFQGSQNMVSSIFADGRWQQLSYFSEWAVSKGGGWGSVTGIIAPLSQQLDVSMLFRHYTPNFYSFYGTAFAEGSRNQNESGLYWGLKYRLNKSIWFTAYFDRFWFPWLRYRISAPSAGYEYLLRAHWQPQKKLLLYAQYRAEFKDRDITGSDKTRVPQEGAKHNYLLNMSYAPDEAVELRSRVQWSHFQHSGKYSRGYLLLQDVSWSLGKLKFSTRYALFQTDDWDNRQYAYEKDVLWSFSIPAYYGRGSRYYALVQWNALQNLSFWLRWSRTHLRDRESSGSGHNQITAYTRSQIKLQLKYDF